MKHYLFLLLLIGSISCKEEKKPYWTPFDKVVHRQDSVIRELRRKIYIDSSVISELDIKLHEGDGQRYFMVSYQVMPKKSHDVVTGNAWFISNGFPEKSQIDSMVYSGLVMKKNCYQNVLVLSLFEFKTIGDYLAYTNDYKGTPNPKKREKCCFICPDDIHIFQVPDSAIHYK